MRTQFNLTVEAGTIDQAWEKWYEKLSQRSIDGTATESRDGDVVGEVINAVTVITDPTRCILNSKIRKLPMRYLIGELLWYMSGNPTLDAIRNYTSAWDRMSDDGVTVNSNYGAIIKECTDFYGNVSEFDQYEYVRDILKKDPNSRQAIIHIKAPRDTRKNPTKDLNCTICLQFFIRDVPRPNMKLTEEDKKLFGKKLFCTTYMRSNDLWMGFPNDVFQFTAIQIRLAMELGVGIGSYTHMAGSLHLYERDYQTAQKNIAALDPSTSKGEGSISN